MLLFESNYHDHSYVVRLSGLFVFLSLASTSRAELFEAKYGGEGVNFADNYYTCNRYPTYYNITNINESDDSPYPAQLESYTLKRDSIHFSLGNMFALEALIAIVSILAGRFTNQGYSRIIHASLVGNTIAIVVAFCCTSQVYYLWFGPRNYFGILGDTVIGRCLSGFIWTALFDGFVFGLLFRLYYWIFLCSAGMSILRRDRTILDNKLETRVHEVKSKLSILGNIRIYGIIAITTLLVHIACSTAAGALSPTYMPAAIHLVYTLIIWFSLNIGFELFIKICMGFLPRGLKHLPKLQEFTNRMRIFSFYYSVGLVLITFIFLSIIQQTPDPILANLVITNVLMIVTMALMLYLCIHIPISQDIFHLFGISEPNENYHTWNQRNQSEQRNQRDQRSHRDQISQRDQRNQRDQRDR